MLQSNPYLTFDGNCREAMSFYKDCLGGDLYLMTVAETPMGAGCPESQKDQIMHSSLTNGSLLLMATDMVGNRQLIKGNNFSISLNCSSEEQINTLFNFLSEGGQVVEPVRKQFWGDLFGVLIDKFDTCWMLNFATQNHD